MRPSSRRRASRRNETPELSQSRHTRAHLDGVQGYGQAIGQSSLMFFSLINAAQRCKSSLTKAENC